MLQFLFPQKILWIFQSSSLDTSFIFPLSLFSSFLTLFHFTFLLLTFFFLGLFLLVQGQFDVVKLLKGFFPLFRSESHFFVSEETFVQQALNGFTVEPVANEDNLLTPVFILPVLPFGLSHVIQDERLGISSLPGLRNETHPGTLRLNPEDVPSLLPASDDVISSRHPDKSLAP